MNKVKRAARKRYLRQRVDVGQSAIPNTTPRPDKRGTDLRSLNEWIDKSLYAKRRKLWYPANIDAQVPGSRRKRLPRHLPNTKWSMPVSVQELADEGLLFWQKKHEE